MRRYDYLLLVLLFLIGFAGLGFSDTAVSNCMVINSPDTYYLTSDLSGAPNYDSGVYACIHVQSDNVTLDCRGHSIVGDYSSASNRVGVVLGSSVTGYRNITLENCPAIWNYTHAQIMVTNAEDITIRNFTVRNASGTSLYREGIEIGSSKNVNVFDGEMYGLREGFKFNDANGSNVENVTIHDVEYSGVYSQDSGNLNFTNVTVYDITGSSPGAVYFASSDNVVVKSSRFYDSSSILLRLEYMVGFSIFNSTINGASTFLVEGLNSNDSEFRNVSFFDGNYGVFFSDSNDVLFYNISMRNASTSSSYNYVYALRCVDFTLDNSVFNITNSASQQGIYLRDSNNSVINNSVIFSDNVSQNIGVAVTGSGITIENTEIHDFKERGINVVSAEDVTISGTVVHDVGQIGLYTSSNTHGVVIEDTEVYGCRTPGYDSIDLYSSDTTLRNVTVRDSSPGGVNGVFYSGSNLTIDGLYVHDVSGSGVYLDSPSGVNGEDIRIENNGVYGIYLGGVSNAVFRNVSTRDNLNYLGIYISSSNNVSLIDAHSYGDGCLSAWNGMWIIQTSRDIKAYNSTLSHYCSSGGQGVIYLSSTNGSYFYNVSVENTTQSASGVYVVGGRDNSFVSGRVYNVTSYGVYVRDSENFTLRGYDIRLPKYHGVYMVRSNYSTIENTVVQDLNSGGSHYDGILISTLSHCDVDNVTVVNSTKGGIYFGSVTDCNSSNLTAHSNPGDYGVYLHSSGDVRVDTVTEFEGKGGVYIYNTYGAELTNLRIENNTDYGFWIRSSEGINVSGTLLSNNSNGALYISLVNDSVISDVASRYNGLVVISSRNLTFMNVSPCSASSNAYGYFVQTSDDITIEDFEVCSAATGGMVLHQSNTTLMDGKIYNAGSYELSAQGPMALDLRNVTILNPVGTLVNHTTLYIVDSVDSGEEYWVRWSARPSALPGGYSSFENKYVEIYKFSGTVSIDEINWSWTDAESSGYDENAFELWKYSAGWSQVSSANLDTSANMISVNNLNPESVYGILAKGAIDSCGVITTSGNYWLKDNLSGAPEEIGNSRIIGGTHACLIINSDDVSISCLGHSITGEGSNISIVVNGSDSTRYDNITITGCEISNYSAGISVYNGSNVDIIGGRIHNVSDYGVVVKESSDVNVDSVVLNVGGEEGIYVYESDGSVINNVTVYNFSDAGVVLSNSDNSAVLNSEMYNSSSGGGLLVDNSYNTTVTNITVYSTWGGMRVKYPYSNHFAHIDISNCSRFGLYISHYNGNYYDYFDDLSLYNVSLGIAFDGSVSGVVINNSEISQNDRGVVVSNGASNITIANSEISSNSVINVLLNVSSNVTFNDVEVNCGGNNCIDVLNSNDTEMEGMEVYNCNDYCMEVDGDSNGISLYHSVFRDSSDGGIYVYSTVSGVDFRNITIRNVTVNPAFGVRSKSADIRDLGIYNSSYALSVNVAGGSADFTNLRIGNSSEAGYIEWSSVSLSNLEVEYGSGLIWDDYFVSFNSSNPNMAKLNVPANITLRTENCSWNIYTATGFPQTRAEIFSLGYPYVALGYDVCSGGIRTFDVGGFSGYTTHFDNVPPGVVLDNPGNNTWWNVSNVDLNYTLSNADDIDFCYYYLNGTMHNLPSCSNVTLSLSNGTYYVNVSAVDRTGNENTTETHVFYVDTTVPSVTVDSPQNTTYNTANIDLNYTASDSWGTPLSCYYYMDGNGPTNISGCSNITLLGVSSGSHCINVYAEDVAHNKNNGSVCFTVSITPESNAPVYSNVRPSTSPVSYTYSEGHVYVFTVDWTDDTGLSNVWIENNFSGTLQNESFTSQSGNRFYYSTELGAGVYRYKWYANDTWNNLNDSMEYRIVNVSKADPSLSMSFSPSSSVSPGTQVNVTCEAVSSQLTVKLYNSSGNEVASGSKSASYSVTYNEEGTYNFTCNTTGNENYTSGEVSGSVAVRTPSSGGGGGTSKKEFAVDYEIECPDNVVVFHVTSSGSDVSGVRAAFKYPDGSIEVENTDSDGEVEFELSEDGRYYLTLTKSGYASLSESYSLEVCEEQGEEEEEEQPQAECEEDSDCAFDEYCSSGSCVEVEQGECGYIENHAWIDYECCSDSDCEEGEVCEEHVCKASQPEENVSGEEEHTGEKEYAENAIADAFDAINSARDAGRDTSEAEEKYQEAQDAFENGDYSKAAALAREAKELAESAPEIKEMEKGEEKGKEEQKKGFDFVGLLIGIVVVGGVIGGAAAIYYYFVMRK